MKLKAYPFLAIMDRLYSVDCAHPHSTPGPVGKAGPKQFWRLGGTLTHIIIFKDGVSHVRYVPSPCVQFLFDCYAQ